MSYWSDVPSDDLFSSPYANRGVGEGGDGDDDDEGGEEKYLTFDWPSYGVDGGGDDNNDGAGAEVERWQMVRAALETAAVYAASTGRSLVLPSRDQGGWGHREGGGDDDDDPPYEDMFHMKRVTRESNALRVLSGE